MSREPELEIPQEGDRLEAKKALGWTAVVVVVTVLAVAWSAHLLRGWEVELSQAGPTVEPLSTTGGVLYLERTPIDTARAGLREQEEAREQLEGWGWVDEPGGIVRIPIERAMELISSGDVGWEEPR